MKTLITALFFVVAVNANASYFATHCSTANGAVKWESGHNSNTISVKYYDETELVKTLSLQEVEIKVVETNVISDETTRGCINTAKRVYVANATISASNENPGALDFRHEQGPIKVQVLCEYNFNSRGMCLNNQ